MITLILRSWRRGQGRKNGRESKGILRQTERLETVLIKLKISETTKRLMWKEMQDIKIKVNKLKIYETSTIFF